jgi:transglutaminase/protease-like cytokinesis protein 3
MNTKTLACATFCQLLAALNFAQTDLSSIDSYVRSLPFHGEKDIILITDSLTSPFETDLEKGRAIFVWITEHIAYDCGQQNRVETEPEEAVHPLYYTQQQVELILKRRRTRCEGYAFMFRTMCRLAGIYATTLEGYARFDGRKVDPATVEPNHAWNAVCFDGEWRELDLSAASGQCDSGQFRRERREEFFQINEKTLERLYIPIDDERNSNNSGRVILKF